MKLEKDEFGRIVDIHKIKQVPCPKSSEAERAAKVPDRFNGSREVIETDSIVQRLSWDIKLIAEEMYANKKTCRELGIILRMGKDTANKLDAQLLRTVHEILRIRKSA